MGGFVVTTDNIEELLNDPQKNKALANKEKMSYPIGALKEPPTNPLYGDLKRLGIDVRPHKTHILFDRRQAESVLTDLGLNKNGKVNFEDLRQVGFSKFQSNVDADIVAKKLREQGVQVKVTARDIDGKKVYSVNYHATPENKNIVNKVTGDYRVSKFKNETWKERFAEVKGVKGHVDAFSFDSPEAASKFVYGMQRAGIKAGKYGDNVVYFDKTQAKGVLKELGVDVKDGDMSVLKKLKIRQEPLGVTSTSVGAEAEAEKLKSLGVKATTHGANIIYIDSPEAQQYHADKINARKGVNKTPNVAGQRPNQDFADDIISQYAGGGTTQTSAQPYEAKPYTSVPYQDEQMAAYAPAADAKADTPSVSQKGLGTKIKEGAAKAGEKLGEAVSKTADTVKKVNAAVDTAKQAAVSKIASVRGGKQAIKAAQVAGKAAKVGGPIATALTAAIDPKGTKEFIDDVTNLRVGKIAGEAWDGTVQLVTNPGETARAIYSLGEDAVKKRYEGAETVGDYTVKTLDAARDGLTNVADVLTHLGSKGYEVGNATRDGVADVANWTMGKLGMDTRMTKGTITYEDYKKDPLGYVTKICNPVTHSASTGLRSDDTIQTVIERGDAKAMQALIARGDDVNANVLGTYTDLDHNKHSTPYDTALGMAVGKGDMTVASVLYKDGKANINGTNEATGDTTFMSILKQTAPDEECTEYYTGRPLDISKESGYSEKAKNDYRLGQAMIDDMIKSGKLDVNAENKEGKNAFLVAAETGNMSAVKELVEKGIDVNKTAKDGSNALHLCCHNQLMTAEMIAKGVDANQTNNKGETPLMVALQDKKNDLCVAQLLDATDSKGVEALVKSEKHAKLLDQWLEEKPEIKLAVMPSKDHPLKETFLARYPEEREAASALAQEEKSQEKQDRQVAETTPKENQDRQAVADTTAKLQETQQSDATRTLASAGQKMQETRQPVRQQNTERGA